MLSYNLSIVLQTIKKHGPISRADIARELQCSKSTISSSIAALQELELVHDVGSGNPKTGRKSILLAFNPTAHYFVAVDLRWKKVNLAIVDMAGEIHSDFSYQRTNTHPGVLTERVKDGIQALIDDSGVPFEKIEAIGIMVPGIVDTDQGIVRYSSTLGWENEVNLVEPIQSRFDRPITIFNDANALALGEIWTGCAGRYEHLAFIYTEGGVGGACVYNGRIILGTNAAAGEFGKVLVSGESGAQRSEALLSLPSLLARYGEDEPGDMEYEEVVRKAIALIGNGATINSTLKMIDEVVDKMAQVIVGIIAIFNPQAVIVNCSYLPDPDRFLKLLEARVSAYLPEKPHRTINLLQSCLNDTTEVIGAAAAAISRSRFHFVLQDTVEDRYSRNYLVDFGRFRKEFQSVG